MSRKRKKKYRRQYHNQHGSEREKAFLQKLKQIFLESGCAEVFLMLPRSAKKALFQCRFPHVKVCFENCEFLPVGMKKQVRKVLDLQLRNLDVTIGKCGNTISLKDFYSYGLQLLLLWYWMKDCTIPGSTEICKLLDKHLTLLDAEEFSRKELSMISMIVSMHYSNFQRHIIRVRSELKSAKSVLQREGLRIHVRGQKPETRMFVVDGYARPAYRVGSLVYNPEDCWISVPRSLFETKAPIIHSSVAVYIQSHAINRLKERLDCLAINYVQEFVYFSLMKPKVICFHGRYLVEYIFLDKKVGYLLVEIINNALFIKTFLFLTNTGTPEGEKLRRLSGLSKTDSKYLTIDRLSAFNQSDIKENEELKQLFIRSGCENLFDVKLTEDGKSLKIAKRMLRYMELEEVL